MNTPDDPDFAFLRKSIRLKLRAGAAYSTARVSFIFFITEIPALKVGKSFPLWAIE
jgi:hypothetical protein